MSDAVAVEDIRRMRRERGIKDPQLLRDIRALRVGDLIRLTLLARPEPFSGETLPVRITSIRGRRFRGELARGPATQALAGLRAGSPLAFGAQHIHSVAKGGRTMIDEILTTSQQNLRGTDSNSLLRMYDLAAEALGKARSQQERQRAERAVRRLTEELGRRNLPARTPGL